MIAGEKETEAGPSRGQGAQTYPSTAVFLMIDSLKTGGSERQFSALARCVDP